MSDRGDLPKPSVLESSNERNFPEVRADTMVLYHGSGVAGIRDFQKAEETTIGQGLYLTSDLNAGRGYAIRRAKRNPDYKPVVYEVEVNNLRLADFRQPASLELFSHFLEAKLVEILGKPDLPWNVESVMRETLDKIRQRRFKHLKDLTWNHQDLTTEIIREQGFDGLVAIEGGEGEEIQNHDTYLIFDPTKGKILRELQ